MFVFLDTGRNWRLIESLQSVVATLRNRVCITSSSTSLREASEIVCFQGAR